MFKFSIITATYNRIDNLKLLYFSIVENKNDLFDIEWVVVVEENDIETIRFLSSCYKKNIIIKIIKNNYPGKFSKLIKQGIKNSTGDYLIILGDDDIPKKNALINIYKFIKKNLSKWLIMPVSYHNPQKKKIRIIITKIKEKLILLNFPYLLKIINYYMTPGVVISRNLILKVDYFNDKAGSSNDWITWLKVLSLEKPDVLNYYCFSAGYNPNTISGSLNYDKYYYLIKIIFNQNSNLLTKLVALVIVFVIFFLNTIFKFYNYLINLFLKPNILNEKKKIVHITRYFSENYQTGGVEQFINQLVKKSKLRNDVITYTNNVEKKIIFKDFNLNIFKKTFVIFNDFFSFGVLKFLIKRSSDYKIIHLHHPHPFSFFYILLLPFRKKIILTYHSDILRFKYIKWFSDLLRFLVNYYINFYHFSSRNFKKECNLKEVKNYFIESFTIKKLTFKKENIAINLIKNLPKKYVLFLGQDRHYKGFDKLEKIILLNLNINFVCVTNYTFNFKSKNLKLFNNVNEDEKTYLMKNSFLLINTSDSNAESFGFSILESLSLGIPCIVFKLNSGTNFLIKNNFNGYIIDNFNIDLFSQRINDLYNNSKLYKIFKKNTYLDYKKRLNHNHEILDKKYRQLLNS